MKQRIDLLLISTRKYNQFLDPLIESVRKYFLVDHKVKIHVFSDKHHVEPDAVYIIPSYGFPEATLLRYAMFNEYRDELDGDFIFYLDVDSLVVDYVGDELLRKGLTAVRHPGFFMNGGWGSMNVDRRSEAWLPMLKCEKYYAGGFQGGSRSHYLVACGRLSVLIQKDEDRGVRAEHNDETHWNYYLNSGEYTGPLNELTPSHMMVQNMTQRRQWKIDGLVPKILALDKDHKLIRS